MPPHTTTLPHRSGRLAPAQGRPALPVTAAARLAEIDPRRLRSDADPGGADRGGASRPSADRDDPAVPPASGVWVDRASWLATVDGEPLELTYLEFEVLDFFVQHPGRAHSREALLHSVWNRQVGEVSARDVRTVDVLVTRLRRKLGPEHRERIETIRRVGYRYRPAEHPFAGR